MKDLDSEKYFYLVLPTDELAEPKKSHWQSHHMKVLPEIYLTCLLSTKEMLQKFMDDLFKAIMSIYEISPHWPLSTLMTFLRSNHRRGGSQAQTCSISENQRSPTQVIGEQSEEFPVCL